MTSKAFFAPILLFVFSFNLNAATRNCTADEKAQANEALKKIASDSSLQTQLIARHLPLGAPIANSPSDTELTLFHNGYISSYDKDLMTTLWTSYELTKADLDNASGKDRVNCFRRDPRLDKDVAATPTDYKEPVFDQGHMTNDADLKDDLIEQVNTYVMSNMSPQHCFFNRGIWLSLEHKTRDWAKEYGDIWITSGAIFDRDYDGDRDEDSDATLMESNNGKSRVAVPSHYYKIILRKDGSENWKSIAFKIPHTNVDLGKSWEEIRPFVAWSITSIEEVEGAARQILFPHIERNKIEQSQSGKGWSLDSGKDNFSSGCN